MLGAVLAQGGKTVLSLPSTTEDNEVSRIVPFLKEGAGVSLTCGDIHYEIEKRFNAGVYMMDIALREKP